MKSTNLIVNESYWSFFESKTFRRQQFIVPEFKDLTRNKFSVAEFTRNIAILMKEKDRDKDALYGLEIKTNGSSRSSRIPMVRYSLVNQSIWKIIFDLKGIEKGIVELNELLYFLKKTSPNKQECLPSKVLLVVWPEADYTGEGKYGKFVISKVEEGEIILISLEFLTDLFLFNKSIDFNPLLSSDKSVITRRPINI